jgi:penicillin-binding protein 1B
MRGHRLVSTTQALALRHRTLLTGLVRIALGVGAVCCFVVLYYFVKFSPVVNQRLSGEVFQQSARIYAVSESERQGDESADSAPLITTFFNVSRARKRPVEFQQIPKTLLAAVLAGEDRAFFSHYGLHPKRIAGAFIFNIQRRALSQGASTITQQLARNLFLTPEPTLQRKVSEAFIALLLEHRLTKEQIFTMYANEVYLGHRDSFAIHGFAEAAKAYFGKDLEELTLSEIAMLAGIIPAPNAYSPVNHPDRAKARRDLILRVLLSAGQISAGEYDKAKSEELKIAPRLDPTEGHYIVDYIRDELLRDFSEKQLMTGALEVHTTVDLQLQQAAIEAVASGLASVENQLNRRMSRSDRKAKRSSPQAG